MIPIYTCGDGRIHEDPSPDDDTQYLAEISDVHRHSIEIHSRSLGRDSVMFLLWLVTSLGLIWSMYHSEVKGRHLPAIAQLQDCVRSLQLSSIETKKALDEQIKINEQNEATLADLKKSVESYASSCLDDFAEHREIEELIKINFDNCMDRIRSVEASCKFNEQNLETISTGFSDNFKELQRSIDVTNHNIAVVEEVTDHNIAQLFWRTRCMKCRDKGFHFNHQLP